MTEVDSYCGLICKNCTIYLATREEDENKRYEMRAEIAQQIEEIYGQKCKPEDVGDCDGCKATTGRLFSTSCKIRECARQKALENCAPCNDYPCGELEKAFASDGSAKERLDSIRSGT